MSERLQKWGLLYFRPSSFMLLVSFLSSCIEDKAAGTRAAFPSGLARLGALRICKVAAMAIWAVWGEVNWGNSNRPKPPKIDGTDNVVSRYLSNLREWLIGKTPTPVCVFFEFAISAFLSLQAFTVPAPANTPLMIPAKTVQIAYR